MACLIRNCCEGGNFYIYVPSTDPRYEIKITLHNVASQGDFCPLEGTEEAVQRLIGAVQSAVEGRFPQIQGDPTGWSASYNSRTKESFVQVKEERVNGTDIALEQRTAAELTLLRARTIATVFDALSEVYAQIAPESALRVESEEVPEETSSLPSAPSLTMTPRRISAPKGGSTAPELFATFNRVSEGLQPQFRGTYLEDLRWQDLLHPRCRKKKFLDEKPIKSKKEAADAVRKLVDNPSSDEEDARLMRGWLSAVVREARRERADQSLVDALLFPLEGAFGRDREALAQELRKWDKSTISPS